MDYSEDLSRTTLVPLSSTIATHYPCPIPTCDLLFSTQTELDLHTSAHLFSFTPTFLVFNCQIVPRVFFFCHTNAPFTKPTDTSIVTFVNGASKPHKAATNTEFKITDTQTIAIFYLSAKVQHLHSVWVI